MVESRRNDKQTAWSFGFKSLLCAHFLVQPQYKHTTQATGRRLRRAAATNLEHTPGFLCDLCLVAVAALLIAQCASALAMPGGHTNAGVYCNHTTEKKSGLISPGGWHEAAIKMQGFDYQTAWWCGFSSRICANFQYNPSTNT